MLLLSYIIYQFSTTFSKYKQLGGILNEKSRTKNTVNSKMQL